jgi:hypothetical protein
MMQDIFVIWIMILVRLRPKGDVCSGVTNSSNRVCGIVVIQTIIITRFAAIEVII